MASRDVRALEQWVLRTPACLRVLFSLTYDPDPLIQWRALEAIGRAGVQISARDTEKVRIFIRGLIWLMTDESGGIGWRAPEAIAEILVNVPTLGEEYAGLLPQYLCEPSLGQSAHAAMARISASFPEVIQKNRQLMLQALIDEVPEIRGRAVSALRQAQVTIPASIEKKILDDQGRLDMYDFEAGTLCAATVANIAMI
ncbi:MAG: hypothetical protein QNJ97_05885 [Myxococcota bacterium]|nr:hypothetical protein [Myxococcota bacterium]